MALTVRRCIGLASFVREGARDPPARPLPSPFAIRFAPFGLAPSHPDRLHCACDHKLHHDAVAGATWSPVKFLPSTSAKPDDNVGRGIEFVVGVVVFFGLGYLVDRWLGTKPIFMIAF